MNSTWKSLCSGVCLPFTKQKAHRRRLRKAPRTESLEERVLLSVTGLQELDVDDLTGTTGEKPQSKTWRHANTWWSVFTGPGGTQVRRLDGTSWTSVLTLHANTYNADVKVDGDVAHVLLERDDNSRLASIEYVPGSPGTYQLWSQRPSVGSVPISAQAETATIDLDSTGRMWVAYDTASSVEVRYADGIYDTWSAPITLATGINNDDIVAMTAMPNNRIGVLWSNQNVERFGFRTHLDSTAPGVWTADEVPASQSAMDIGFGMADDHLNLAVASDNTVYAAVKTGYDNLNHTSLGLLVRRPDETWDDLYHVDNIGTRPIAQIGENETTLVVAYRETDSSGPIVYRESPLSTISFGPKKTLIDETVANNVSGSKDNVGTDVVFIAGGGGNAYGVRAIFGTPTNTAPEVDAGPDFTGYVVQANELDASVMDDGLPLPTNLTTTWSVVSGPGNVTFGDASAVDTTAVFDTIGTYVLRLTADDTALTTTDDITITVDPLPPTTTVSFRNGEDGYTGTRDTRIRSDFATDNFGDTKKLELDGSPDQVSLISWDITSIPAGVEVLTATIEFNVIAVSNDSFDIYEGLRAWDEATATFNEASAGQSWQVPGAAGATDRGATSLGTVTGPTLGTRIITLNATGRGVLENWINTPGQNNGFVIQNLLNQATDDLDLSSSEASVSTRRPKLVVTYATPNSAPNVDAGADQGVEVSDPAALDGTATDDGLPSPANLVTAWTKTSGPGTVTFGDAAAVDTTAVFSTPGTYVLRLTANDGELQTFDELTVTVTPDNVAPTVDAGADQLIETAHQAALDATVSDDGLPTPANLTTTWSMTSGPGTVTFGDATAVDTTASFSADGTYVLRLTANDGELSAFDELTILVQPNQAPTADAGSDDTILINAQASLDGTVGDDGLPVPSSLTTQWTVTSGPGNVTFGDSSAVDTTAQFDAVGIYTLRLTANDGALSTSDEVVITVDPLNVAPTVDAGADQLVESAQPATLDGTVTDDGRPEPVNLTSLWTAISGPGTVTFGDATAVDTTATFSADGVYVLRLTADDSDLTAFDELTITVQPNQTPTVAAGADQLVESGLAAALDATVTDDGLPAPTNLTTLWTVISGPGTVTFGDATAVDTTASFGADGDYVLRLTADDSALTAFDEITITVQPNQTPTVSAGTDQIVESGHAAALDGTVSDDGLPTPANLSTLWTVTSGPGAVTFGDASTVDTTATFAADGVYVLRLTADDSALSAFDELTITVQANQTPTVDAGIDQLVESGQPASLDGTVADDGLPHPTNLTTQWTVTSGPGTVTFGDVAAIDTTAVFSADGVYVLRLSADDSALSAFDELTITVQPNQAPTVDAGADQLVESGLLATLAATVADDGLPNPTSLTTVWSVTSGPGTVTFGDPAAVNTTASFGADGVYVLRMTANDSALTTFDELTISVQPNQAPTVAAGGDQAIEISASASLDGTVSDDGLPVPASVTTLWSAISGPGTVTFGDPSAVDTTAAFSATGTYVLRLTADDSALTGFDEITIIVTPNNTAPTVSAGTDGLVESGQPAALDGTVTDDGLPLPTNLTTLWTLVQGPGLVTFGDPTVVDTTANFTVDGVYVLRLTANDSALTAFDDVTLTVQPNQAPTVDAGADQLLESGLPATLDATVADDGLPNPTSLTTTWSVISGPGTVTFGDPSAVNTTASFGADGVYVLRMTANDSALTTFDELTISVQPNQAPTVAAGGDQAIEISASASLDGTVSDDGLPVPASVTTLWSAISGPGTVTFGDPSAVDTTAAFSATGTYVLRLTADDSALTGFDEITIIVTPNNTAPTVSAGTDGLVESGQPAALDGTVTDDGLPLPTNLTTLWTLVQGPGLVTFGDPTAVDTTADFTVDGVYVLRLTANDSALTAFDDVTLTVQPNQAPTVDAGADQLLESGLPATLDATVADDGLPNPTSLTTTWSVISGPGTVTFGDPSAVNTTASFGADGVYVLRMTANDSALTTFDELTITVQPNQTPTVAAGDDQLLESGLPATLDATVDDDGLPNPTNLTTLWTVTSGPGTVTFGNAAAVDTTASFSVDGVYVLRLTADDTALTAFDELTITVQPNQTPTVDAGIDATTEVSDTVPLDGTVSDDGLPSPASLTTLWTVTSGPAAVTFGDATAVDTTADFAAPGIYVLRLTADDTALQGFDEVTITVTPDNTAPTVEAGADQNVAITTPASLDGTITDDGLPLPASLTSSWSVISGPGTVTFGDASAVDTTASFSVIGVYVLRLTANDGELSSFDELTITVDTGNDAPTVDAGTDQSVVIPEVANLDGTVSDDGMPTPANLTTTWTRVSGPGTVSFGDANAVDTTASFSSIGTYTLRLTASDGQLETSDDVVITVEGTTTVTFQNGLNGYTGTTDTRIRSDIPTQNFGTTKKLELDGNPDQVSLLRFDLSSLPVGTNVTAVSITFNVLEESDDDFEFYEALRTWDELSATFPQASTGQPWDQPGATGATDRGSDVLAAITAPNTGARTVHLNAAGLSVVQRWINDPPSNRGFVIQDTNNGSTDDLDVSASEASNRSRRPAISITYSIVNQAPTVDAGDNATVFDTQQLSLDGTVTDDGLPVADPSTLWSVVSGPGTVTFGDATAVDTTASFSATGSYILRLTADDTDMTGFDELEVTVQPTPPNAPPTVDAGSDVESFVGANFALDATVTDDGLPVPTSLTTTWSVISGPGTVKFGDSSAVDTTASADTAGSYVLRLTAFDGALTTADELTVTITSTQTVSLQNGVAGYAGTTDTRIRSDFPNRNFGSSPKLELDGNPDQISLFRWDLSSIPTGATVLSATITLDVIASSRDDFEIYEALRSWDESSATFNLASAGTSWQVPGAAGSTDRGSTILGAVTGASTGLTTATLNSAGRALLQSWIANPATNKGFIVSDLDNGSTDDLDLSSSETASIASRPKLTITYGTPGTPLQADGPAGSGGESDVTAVTAALDSTFDRAVATWQAAIGLPVSTDISWEVRDLGPGQLGAAHILRLDEHGQPAKSHIVIDDDADGAGWSLDFDSVPAHDRYDLRTVVLHELGHALGFTDEHTAFAERLHAKGDSSVFIAPGVVAWVSDGDHLDSRAHSGDLMTASLATGQRRELSELDAAILRTVRQDTVGFFQPTRLSQAFAEGRATDSPDRVTTEESAEATTPLVSETDRVPAVGSSVSPAAVETPLMAPPPGTLKKLDAVFADFDAPLI